MGDATSFDTWLSERFRELNTDEAVFVPYVKSIVEGDESAEEKIDALDGILGELAETDGNLDVEAFRTEIMSRWEQQSKEKGAMSANGSSAGDASTELEAKMERLLKLSDNLTSSSSNHHEDEKGGKGLGTQIPDSTLRAAILNQCQDTSDNESDGEKPSASTSGGGGGGGGARSLGLERNTNAERVQGELKEKREREKAESAKKREKDKEDRQKQKQQAQERKDKAKKKATKVERKR